jgi:transposase InsO family protein
VGDITCLRTGEEWLYLATVIDLATRIVTSWQLAAQMRTSLVTQALDMAIGGRLAQWAEVPGAPPGRGDVGSHATSLRDRLTTSPRLRRTSVNRLKNLPA